MPIYEYKCLSCGKQLEVMQKISDESLKECPNCQGQLEKQWSLSGFQFKGTGWYVSDYANRGSGSAEGKAEGKPESGSEVKKEGQGAATNSAEKESTATVSPTSSDNKSTADVSSASKPATTVNKPSAKTD